MATANSHSLAPNLLPQTLWQQLHTTANSLNQAVHSLHWVIALSGGKDSVALSHAMAQLDVQPDQVTLAHIHHGLMPQADEWQQHCKTLAQEFGFAFFTQNVNVSPQARESVEASARQARYAALRSFCQKKSAVLLLAQHLDDQLETVLLQLKRGAGPKGLSGMPQQHKIAGVVQLRPWLDVSQQQVDDYAAHYKLHYVDDPSNQDERFDRNFLRASILPLLTQRWPGLAAAVKRSAELCATQTAMIEQRVRTWLISQQTQCDQLPLGPFLSLDAAWQAETLRMWCADFAHSTPSKAQCDAFLNALICETDKLPALSFANVRIRKHGQTLYISTEQDKCLTEKDEASQALQLGKNYYLASLGLNISLLATASADSLTVQSHALASNGKATLSRFSAEHKLRLSKGNERRLKKVLKESGVPPWVRQDVLCVMQDDVLVALLHQHGATVLSEKNSGVSSTDNHVYLEISRHTGPYQRD